MKRIIIATLVLVVFTAAGTAAWHFRPIQHEYYTDADTIKTPAETARLRDILWQPPTKLPDNINELGQISEPAISGDGMTLYFVRGRAGNNTDIYFSQRTPTGWGDPRLLEGINSTYDELGPEISADGSTLYFYSDRKGGVGGYDLWVTHRNHDGWAEPDNLGEKVNSDFDDYGPALSPDGLTLYFSSNRLDPDAYIKPTPTPQDQPAFRDESDERSYNLYSASITKNGFAEASPLVALNTKYNEGSPAVSPFYDFLYFTSDRTGGRGGYDLYRTRRVEGKFQAIKHLGDEINTPSNELDPVLSLGGYGLYFTSNREQPIEGAETVAAYNIFYTTSREVYHDIERIPPPPLNFGAWWSRIGPNLLWAMFALSMLLLLWAMMKSLSERRMSLLAKCMTVSVALHLMLLFMFNVWQVTSSIAGESKRRGKIQIALASPSSGGEIASQIRGQAGEIEPPAWQESPTERPNNIPEAQPESAQTSMNVQRFAMAQQESPQAFHSPNDVTLERQQDVPRREPQIRTADVPTKVEVATQKNPTRIEIAEANPTQPTDSTQPVEMSRPNIHVTPTHAKVAQVNPSPNHHQQPSPNESVSLMPQVVTHDAQPANLAQTRVADRPLTTEPYPMSEFAPTITAVARRVQVTEAKIQIAASMTPPPRAVVQPDVFGELSTLEASIKQLQPSSVPQPRDASTVDTHTFAQASEALPALDAAHPTSSNPSVDLNNVVAMKAVALPSLEVFSVVAATETVEVKISRTVKHLRGALAKGPLAQQPSYAIQEFSPETPSSMSRENSLADATMDHIVDITPGSMIESTLAWANTKTSLPPMTELSLPIVEEESNTTYKENKSMSVKVVKLSQPRALSGRDMITDPVSARTAYFAVPITILPNKSKPTLVVETLADHRKIDHPKFMPVSFSESIDDRHIASMTLDLAVPVEENAPASLYLHRTSPNKLEIVERLGGSEKTEASVDLALKWLARHQHKDGHWDSRSFDKKCGACGGETDIEADVALTGLATLCYLGAGHTHTKDGPYQKTIKKSILWLKRQQQDNGDFRNKETMYTQAIATIAMSEAFGMTDDQSLVDIIQRATRFIYHSRSKDEGGWRYDPGQAGDTSVLGWVLMSFKSASMSGVEIPRHALDVSREWLNKVGGASEAGLYSYKPGQKFTPSMTAESMFAQQLLGADQNDPRTRGSIAYILQNMPNWDQDPNTYYWYYATLALFQHQGDAWKKWNAALTQELLDHQHTRGRMAGSWDPEGEWASVAGRVYQTALCTLMLEVYYRYLPLYSIDDPTELAIPEGTIGSMTGIVTDAKTGRPLEDTTIVLDLPDLEVVTARTDADGHYILYVPEVPEFFAVSATRDGYVPDTANVSGDMLRKGPLQVHFELNPVSKDVIVLETTPEVHHLGDNRFEGSINSQFQKDSEGTSYASQFELQDNQVKPHIDRAEVHLLAKGVQRRHKIFINGHVLKRRLDRAPRDGSFGDFSASFEASLLRAGTNTIEIVAAPSDHDIDDFEFVNVQIQLIP